MNIDIDESRCIGSGQCAFAAPAIFVVNDDGLSEVLPAAPMERHVTEIDEAVRFCPTGAIVVVVA